jgi:diacylglycerol kinase
LSTPIAALRSSLRGMSLAARSEAAFRRELIALAFGLPIALLISEELWTWAALISVLLLILAIELLNTAIEKLCDRDDLSAGSLHQPPSRRMAGFAPPRGTGAGRGQILPTSRD